ncbi:DUF1738 domain-containing protein [Acidithiobacillus thiooxidans]|uniref:ArdC family protein n=1 Tax=Acidithiobacillus thiooxidans TaxID=930 RepID=UPI001C0787A0|nr:zincin-like metallopeptidase domain-containing protein [Acidithiobacillus thiooxidans]MBU2834214.1 DUF1738 domain-containing protein [Acidithiobacillus thiooxidans]
MAKNQRKIDVRQELAEKLMQQMETGSAFWQKPWDAGSMEMPFNTTTGKPYKGVNAQYLMLFSPDPADNRWCTYKQAKEQGWQVKKGEHGIPIEKWSEYTHKRTAEEIQKIREAGAVGPIESEEKRLGVRYYTVFHASQIDGIPDRERGPEIAERNNAVDPRLPMLAEAMGVEVQHSGSRAFYRPSQDRVNLPPVELFKTGRDHDTVFLHELSHSTGHPERMHRDLSGKFGSQKYAKEELRAELSAAMTALSLGMGFSPEAQQQEEGREVVAGVENTAAYLNNWLKGLPEKDRQKELMSAISEAQKISDYLMERTPELKKGLDQELVGFVRGMTQDDQDNHIEFIREAAKLDPEKASRWAEALRSNPHEYAKEANPDLLHADNMVGIATQLEIGAQEIEQKQEHKMATDKYFVLDEHTLGFIRPDEAPDFFTPLAGERDWRRGGFHVLQNEKTNLRPATEADFEKYRVVPPPDFREEIAQAKEQKVIKQHRFVLTHRTDLKDRVREEPHVPGKPDIKITTEATQAVSGTLQEVTPSGFVLQHPEHGQVTVETHKNLSMLDEKALSTLQEAMGKPVKIAVDKTGTDLSIAVQDGPTITHNFQSPIVPLGMMKTEHLDRSWNEDKSFKGELLAVHNDRAVELVTEKGHLMIVGQPGNVSPATMRLEVGRRVEITAGKNQEIVMRSLEKSKGLSL